jgi:hypothetical protein
MQRKIVKLTRTERLMAGLFKLGTVAMAAETGHIAGPIVFYFVMTYTMLYLSRTFLVPKESPELQATMNHFREARRKDPTDDSL